MDVFLKSMFVAKKTSVLKYKGQLLVQKGNIAISFHGLHTLKWRRIDMRAMQGAASRGRSSSTVTFTSYYLVVVLSLLLLTTK